MTIAANFTFTASADQAGEALSMVQAMSGVLTSLESDGEDRTISVELAAPFGSGRLDNVESLIASIVPSVIRA